MKLAALIAVTTALVGCSQIPHESLLGYWKSNESKTLESMHATTGVTEEAKKLLENDFFGHFVVEYRQDTYRAKSEIEEENIEEFYQYYPYKVIEKGKDYYLIESYSHLLEENEVTKIYMAENCYYLLITKWNFREYYCKLKK